MKREFGRILTLVSVVLLVTVFAGAEDIDYQMNSPELLDVLQLAETVSGPGQSAFPLFAPIDMGAGYEDTIAPVVILRNPAPNEVDVPIDAAIRITLADYGSGVDGSSVQLFLNDQAVSPTITGGADNVLDLTYQSPEPFEYASRIEVALSGADYAVNRMSPDAFTFTTNKDATRRPSVSISTNKGIYTDGQMLVVQASLKNPHDVAFDVMVYIALDVSGTLFYFPAFQTSPMATHLTLEPGFHLPPVVIFKTPLFGLPEGTYTWYAAVVNVETDDVGQVSCAQFDFVPTQ